MRRDNDCRTAESEQYNFFQNSNLRWCNKYGIGSQIYSQILVENRRFNLPHLHLAPPSGVTPLEFRRDLWHQKTS